MLQFSAPRKLLRVIANVKYACNLILTYHNVLFVDCVCLCTGVCMLNVNV